MIDLRQIPEYARYMKLLGWKTTRLNQKLGIRNYAYIRKIPLIGNIAKIQRPAMLPTLGQLNTLHRKYNLAAVYIEPMTHDLSQMFPGFQFAKTCFLPSKTIQIDLQQAEEKIFNQMKSKTRYNTRLAQRLGVKVNQSVNIEAFIELWHQSARRRGFFFSQKKEIKAMWNAFGNKACLLFAEPLAGLLLLLSPTAFYYMYAASTREGNKVFAPSFLVWEAIKLAKKKGCKIFDFEGIYDKRYPQTNTWKGFTRFKEGFGGDIVEYPKTLVRYYNPILKILAI